VGKTTTSLHLGRGLINKGNRVLFIDLDPQGNLSFSLNADNNGMLNNSALDVLNGSTTAKKAIQSTEYGDVIASSEALSGADKTLIQIGKEHKLEEALKPISSAYDFIIIDTPPALSILTVNALTASNGAIIPAQADMYSLQGISQLNNTIEAVRQYTNPDIKVIGILLVRFTERMTASQEVSNALEEYATNIGTKVFDTKIRESTIVREAQISRDDLFSYAPKHKATKDYEAFINEFMEEEI